MLRGRRRHGSIEGPLSLREVPGLHVLDEVLLGETHNTERKEKRKMRKMVVMEMGEGVEKLLMVGVEVEEKGE